VEDIEANLVPDPELDEFDLQNHFAHPNAQKRDLYRRHCSETLIATD
jgi:hypothetical protein